MIKKINNFTKNYILRPVPFIVTTAILAVSLFTGCKNDSYKEAEKKVDSWTNVVKQKSNLLIADKNQFDATEQRSDSLLVDAKQKLVELKNTITQYEADVEKADSLTDVIDQQKVSLTSDVNNLIYVIKEKSEIKDNIMYQFSGDKKAINSTTKDKTISFVISQLMKESSYTTKTSTKKADENKTYSNCLDAFFSNACDVFKGILFGPFSLLDYSYSNNDYTSNTSDDLVKSGKDLAAKAVSNSTKSKGKANSNSNPANNSNSTNSNSNSTYQNTSIDVEAANITGLQETNTFNLNMFNSTATGSSLISSSVLDGLSGYANGTSTNTGDKNCDTCLTINDAVQGSVNSRYKK